MFRVALIAYFFLVLAAGLAAADTSQPSAVFSSGERQVTLVELYTSEGCSSCPPADRWLSGLKEDSGLWKRFVPIAFHVDYWDYIGWEDRFAQAEYSDRQRQYAAEGGARFVYTPGVFYQGADTQGWRSGGSIATDDAKVGDLTVRVDGSTAAIRFDNLNGDIKKLTAHVAVLGMNLATSVRAGENKGRRLNHDFVALDVVSSRLKRSGTEFTTVSELPEISSDADGLALAVWVSAAGSQAPIQSVGGYLAPNPAR